MDYFTAKNFTIPTLKGISQKSIDEHIKLYQGYVKFSNYILNQITEFSKEGEKYTYELGELQRRFAFEFNGMRNHELYFHSLEGGTIPLANTSLFKQAIEHEWGSFDAWLARFKSVALTRGIGWAMLYYDKESGHFLHQWIDEQHLGHLGHLSPIIALDMWEHSYVLDYLPSGKKNYIEDFFANLNWQAIEKNFENAQI